MTIGLASDHRGYRAKNFLKDSLYMYDVIDYGTDTEDSVDFPVYAKKLGTAIVNGEVDLGIAICGTGIGISIACNKVKGVRCAKVDNIKEAELTRKDNDANVLALNGSMPLYRAKDIVDTFFKTEFTNVERYVNRINAISEYENNLNKKKHKKEEK